MTDIKIAMISAIEKLQNANDKVDEYYEKVQKGIQNLALHFEMNETECAKIFWGKNNMINNKQEDKSDKSDKSYKSDKSNNSNKPDKENEINKKKSNIVSEKSVGESSVFKLSADEVHKMKVKEVSDILKSFGLKFKATKEEGGKKYLQQLLITHIQNNQPIDVSPDEASYEEYRKDEESFKDDSQKKESSKEDSVKKESPNEEFQKEKDQLEKSEYSLNVENKNCDNIIEEIETFGVTESIDSQADNEEKIDCNEEKKDCNEEEADVNMITLENGDEVAIDYKKCLIYKMDDEGDWIEVGTWNKENNTMLFNE